MTDTSEPAPPPPPVASAPPTPAAPEEPPVEIHKPKPVRNWREFAKEYAIIVLGVATALAAEQAVEWLHWRDQVQQARESIASETAQNLVSAIRRMRTVQCGERRLNALGQILDEAARSGTLPPVGVIGHPPRGAVSSSVWDTVVASQTATHFSRQELSNLGSLYRWVGRTEIYQNIETEAWSSLYAMVGPGRRLDPASEAELRKSLGSARNANRTLAQIGSFLVTEASKLNLSFNREDLDSIATAEKQPLTGTNPSLRDGSPMSLICGPIGPVPAHYGEAQLSASPALIEERVRSLPDFSRNGH